MLDGGTGLPAAGGLARAGGPAVRTVRRRSGEGAPPPGGPSSRGAESRWVVAAPGADVGS
ncbi:hypothetical protein GCM10019016_058660 [Streptomyces prasinosporus]|uniref:Uncharacterized protein n=1 Tax=Streptomyces prasinosporus TaxID=68256 RepID=A0ABP6TWC9_9ACTN